MVRDSVRTLLALGKMPDEGSVSTAEEVDAFDAAITAIEAPVTDAEARLLVDVFGPKDSCFGIAWSLLHLIETAPNWPLWDALEGESEWIETLRERARKSEAVEEPLSVDFSRTTHS